MGHKTRMPTMAINTPTVKKSCCQIRDRRPKTLALIMALSKLKAISMAIKTAVVAAAPGPIVKRTPNTVISVKKADDLKWLSMLLSYHNRFGNVGVAANKKPPGHIFGLSNADAGSLHDFG